MATAVTLTVGRPQQLQSTGSPTRGPLLAPEPAVARRSRRALPIATFTPASVNLARREPAPLPEREADARPARMLGSEGGERGASASGRDAEARSGSPRRRRSRPAGGTEGDSRARTVRQTAERSRSWAALSSSPGSSMSLLSPEEEKALAKQIKELQRIEGVREGLRTAASRSLIKIAVEMSPLDGPAPIRDTEPKPAELARACMLSVRDLQASIEAGKRAREQLVRRNMPLVAQLALQLAKGKVGVEDVVQEGAKGLLRAAELYDPSRDIKFSTYAYRWIHVHASRAFQNHGRTVRVPVHVYERLPALARAKSELVASLCRQPTKEEVAARLGSSVNDVEMLERTFAREESLDVAQQISRGFKSGSRKTTLEDDLVAPDSSRGAEADIDNDIFLADLKTLLSTLLPKERYVLTQYFGVGGSDPRSFKEQAKEIGVPVKVIERLARSGLEKLRHPSRAMYLLPFLDLPALGGGGGADD